MSSIRRWCIGFLVIVPFGTLSAEDDSNPPCPPSSRMVSGLGCGCTEVDYPPPNRTPSAHDNLDKEVIAHCVRAIYAMRDGDTKNILNTVVSFHRASEVLVEVTSRKNIIPFLVEII